MNAVRAWFEFLYDFVHVPHLKAVNPATTRSTAVGCSELSWCRIVAATFCWFWCWLRGWGGAGLSLCFCILRGVLRAKRRDPSNLAPDLRSSCNSWHNVSNGDLLNGHNRTLRSLITLNPQPYMRSALSHPPNPIGLSNWRVAWRN